MDDLLDCYRILDLEPGASFEEIKRSYHELVRVWHPDRFRDPKLRTKAEEKLKRINLAYERLCKEEQEATDNFTHERPSAATRANQDAKTTTDMEAGAPPTANSEHRINWWNYRLRQASIVVVVILLLICMPWILSALSGKSRESAGQAQTPSNSLAQKRLQKLRADASGMTLAKNLRTIVGQGLRRQTDASYPLTKVREIGTMADKVFAGPDWLSAPKDKREQMLNTLEAEWEVVLEEMQVCLTPEGFEEFAKLMGSYLTDRWTDSNMREYTPEPFEKR